MRFELPRASICFRHFERQDACRLRSEFDPYPLLDSDGEFTDDVVVEAAAASAPHFVDVQNPAADGCVTGSDGHDLHIVEGGRACAIPRFDGGPPFRFRSQQGFPVRTLVRSLLRPALQLALLHHGCVAVHGTAVDLDGAGIVVAGWSESGKTETALALLEGGASFVSDKWTIVAPEHELAPFPISVGVRRWVLPYLPRLKSSLPRAARLQLGLAAAAAVGTRPIRRGGRSGRLPQLASTNLERGVTLLERAALAPSQVSRIYGAERPVMRTELRAVVLLTTVSSDTVALRTVQPRWAARRLARSASYERRGFFDLHRRLRYSFPDSLDDLESTVEISEEQLLTQLLEGTMLFEATAPFPTDPRRVADAILRHL